MWWLGDIPGWLSLILAVVIAVAGYVNRNKIGGWLGTLMYRRPPVPAEPVWEFNRVNKTMFTLSNSGTGTAHGVKIKTNVDDVYLEGTQGWEEFPSGWTSEPITMIQTTGEPSLDCEISWHIEDRNEESGWRKVSDPRLLPMDRPWA